jgi:hypothetical protein
MTRLSILILLCFMAASNLRAEVAAPNYNFSLEALQIFVPGNKQTTIEEKMGKGEVLEQSGVTSTKKYYVAHLRYKFPVMVQYNNGEVADFYARLPSYFLHDIFLQSLVNKLGKQNTFQKKGEEAVYSWNNKDGKDHVYGSSCTITCFPVFYTVMAAQTSGATGGYSPLYQKLQTGYR